MKYAQLAVLGIGFVLMFTAVAWDRDLTVSDLRVSGALLVLTGLGMAALKRLNRNDETVYDNGHRDGYREGYDAGRRVRGSIVALPTERLCRENAANRGKHAARCRDNCKADNGKGRAEFDSPEWSTDGSA